jgi:hypothetical protein
MAASVETESWLEDRARKVLTFARRSANPELSVPTAGVNAFRFPYFLIRFRKR